MRMLGMYFCPHQIVIAQFSQRVLIHLVQIIRSFFFRAGQLKYPLLRAIAAIFMPILSMNCFEDGDDMKITRGAAKAIIFVSKMCTSYLVVLMSEISNKFMMSF